MGNATERFARRENVKHYRGLLTRTTDLKRRELITDLLAEEEIKQIEDGDFDSERSN